MKIEKILVINDLHVPFENGKAIKLALEVAKRAKIDRVIINGDLLDMWEISKYHKDPGLRSRASLKGEIDKARQVLSKIRAAFPKAKIDFIYGNHEHRWDVYIASHAKELAGLDGLSLADQFKAKELDINVIYSGNRESTLRLGKLVVGHFDKVSQHSALTAKSLADAKGISLIQGHCHRGGSYYKRLWDRDIVAFENFCLCDRSPVYVDTPNWQLGFSLVYKDVQSDFFYVEQHPIVEDSKGLRTIFGGEIFHIR